MDGWSWSLLLKPVIGMGLLVAYYLVVVKGLRWLYPKLPRSRLVDALFRERGNKSPDYGQGFDSVVGKGRRSRRGSGKELQ